MLYAAIVHCKIPIISKGVIFAVVNQKHPHIYREREEGGWGKGLAQLLVVNVVRILASSMPLGVRCYSKICLTPCNLIRRPFPFPYAYLKSPFCNS
jgi:hypothetical protein